MILYGCSGSGSGAHDGHDHTAETAAAHAAHDHEGHDHSHEEEAHEGEAAAAAGHSDEIIFTKAQAARTDFALYTVEPVTFHEVIRASGQILAAQGDEASVVAPQSGIVSFGTARMADGVSVRQGQALFYVSSRNLPEGDYATRIQAAYQQAKAAYERAQKLVEEKIVSQTEFEQTRLAYENARNAYESLGTQSPGKGTGVSSPINGYITGITVKEGDYVEVGQVLATVSQNRRLTLRADVSEKYFPALRGIVSANFRTSYSPEIYSLAELHGRLLSVGKASGAGSYYIPVTFEFDNKGGIIPGSYADVYLIGAPMKDVLAVPATAITEEMGYHYVYVQLDDEGYRKQEVTTGATDGEMVRILSGLKAGETIVSRGAYQVKMAAMSGTAIPHGHTH